MCSSIKARSLAVNDRGSTLAASWDDLLLSRTTYCILGPASWDDNSIASPTKALLELQMRLRAANSPRLVDRFLETKVMLLGQGGSAYIFERIHASASPQDQNLDVKMVKAG
jgi:hypothetical protein